MSANYYEVFDFVFRNKDKEKLSVWERTFLKSIESHQELLKKGCCTLSEKQVKSLVKISEKLVF